MVFLVIDLLFVYTTLMCIKLFYLMLRRLIVGKESNDNLILNYKFFVNFHGKGTLNLEL